MARAAEGVTTNWFDETLSDYTESSSTRWITSAGRWTLASGDMSSCSNEEHRVYVSTLGNELVYIPTVLDSQGVPTSASKPSPTNAYTRIVFSNTVFTACCDGDEWLTVSKIPLAALSLRRHNDNTLTFVGWVTTRDGSTIKGRWLELSTAGVAAAENVAYTVLIETDFRTIPNRVRYSINGLALTDARGNDWFSIRNASLNPASESSKRVSQICFNGSGSVGPIVAESTSAPVVRGTVDVAPTSITRPVAGETTLDASKFSYSGEKLSGNASYQWYLIDAAGMKVAGSERGTGSTYTLASADYGHWVAVDVSDENGYYGTGKFWFSNLPVVYITCFDELGYVETDDQTAQEGKIYYSADDDDNFTAIEGITAGDDLTPYRELYGKLYLADISTVWPTSKKEDHKAYITITGNDDWEAQYTEDGISKKGKETASQIHVRGNSTASQDKKPYKIKLGKKTDLFEMGGGEKNKHWVLLANCFDESLMRNKICYDYSSYLGLVGMHSVWVDVVMNGKFVGNYQLCQHIRVAKERIDIYNWSDAYEPISLAAQVANPDLSDDDVSAIETLLEEEQMGWMADGRFTYLGTNYTVVAEGTSGPDGQGGFTVVWEDYSNDITGGYVFELDWKKSGASASALAPSAFVQNHSGAGGQFMFCLAMNTPEYCFTSEAVSNYVWNCWNDIGEAWSSGTGYNSKGQHYSEICDFESMLNYWLSIIVPGNNDAGGLSRYAYKDCGGKMTFGPAWDFDYGLGSLQIRSRDATVTNEYGEATYAPIKPTGWIPGASAQNFMGGWNSDPYFMYRLRERYLATRDYLTDIVKDGGLIDQYIEYLGPSARANDLRWNNRIGFFGNAEEQGDAYVLKDFLTRRFAWMDGQFANNLGTALTNLTKTTTSSGRYSRTTAVDPTVAGATNLPESVETDLNDVALQVKMAPVSITLAVPTANAAAVVTYVNGVSNGVVAVSDAQATVEIAAADLKTDAKNLIQFRVCKADGTLLANNLAFVTASLPAVMDVGSGEGQVPAPVTTSWLDDAYARLVATNAVFAEDAPKSYADYVAFAKSASPVGKSTSIWEDFVTDTNPADDNDEFSASIEMTADGLPRIVWRPDRSDKGGVVVRNYTLRGANSPSTPAGEWDSCAVSGKDDSSSETFRRNHKFFKVEVALP